MTDHNTSAESVEDVLREIYAFPEAAQTRTLQIWANRIESAIARERANSSASIPVTIELSADGDTFIARAAGINYVASGANGDEAKRNFARGLIMTLAAHVERMRQPDRLLAPSNSSESPKVSLPPRWYCVSKGGIATLCVDEANARAEAAENDELWPTLAPHVAVQLVPVGAQPLLSRPGDALSNAGGALGSLWVIRYYSLPGVMSEVIARHNAVADYRAIDPGATAVEYVPAAVKDSLTDQHAAGVAGDAEIPPSVFELARKRIDAGAAQHGQQWVQGGRTAINFIEQRSAQGAAMSAGDPPHE